MKLRLLVRPKPCNN